MNTMSSTSGKIDVSFVVPVYNVQDYVQECLESILQIKDFEYEVVIINDGSTDNSLNIVERFSHFSNVKIISQNNRGLSAARNTGIAQSKGQYVIFIDSDDKIDASNTVRLILNGIYGSQLPDIILGDFYNWKGAEITISRLSLGTKRSGKGVDILLGNYPHRINSVVWRGIYRRDFLIQNRLYFEEGIFFEDVEWMPRALYQASNISYFPIPFYYYRLRENSIMTSVFTYKKFCDCITICHKHILYSMDKESNVASLFLNSAFYCLYKAIISYPDSHTFNSISMIMTLSNIKKVYPFSKVTILYRAYLVAPKTITSLLRILNKLKAYIITSNILPNQN